MPRASTTCHRHPAVNTTTTPPPPSSSSRHHHPHHTIIVTITSSDRSPRQPSPPPRTTILIPPSSSQPPLSRTTYKGAFGLTGSTKGAFGFDSALRNFGFGTRWRDWIQSCLKSSRGSILVNGSPTSEFQYYKGLKQGDPLSPFLFILVMESLHLSFHNVVTAGLFNGQWRGSNISTIIHVLDCFFRASSLRINLHKSTLIGVAADPSSVEAATNDIGCMALNLPFSYLGINIGGHMSRIKAWDNVINKVLCRLSKWKMKSFSIGGRLTLLKSVLGSTPIYSMSMFKAPIHVLKKLESIRKKGGLGVSSFYALNRALIFKWIWRFRTQNNSLWSRLIKAIHVDDGKLGSKPSFSSNWTKIIRDIPLLYNK
ncbi:RNA-directed DNA polymerase, eukaryota, partial [Tanacetum coccineum]